MTIKALPALRSRNYIVAGCAAVLIWLVISRSFAAYLADAAPHLALWLNPRLPEALLNLADRSLNSSAPIYGPMAGDTDQTPDEPAPGSVTAADPTATGQASQQKAGATITGKKPNNDTQNLTDAFATVGQDRSVDLAEVRSETMSALMREPLNARALRILGQVSDASNDPAATAKFMAAAARLSLHDTIADFWLMRKSVETGDAKTAIAYADILLRTDPAMAYYAVPVLGRYAGDKTSTAAVEALLVKNPPWRPLFFALLPQSVSDARTPLKLLLALKNSSTPPNPVDIKRYLDLLIEHKFYELAYYTWLQFLPLDQLRNAALLFNGSFEITPSGMPFDWTIKQGAGVTIDIVPRPGASERRALEIDFLFGRVDYHSVSELVVLPPGTYHFSGQYSGKISGPRGLKWRIVCANESRTRIGESAMISGGASTWKETDVDFTVPSADCRAQYVQLDLDARMASEQIVSGKLWFDDLEISRLRITDASAATVGSQAPKVISTSTSPAAK